MLTFVGELVGDPNEDRYSDALKLRRLNLVQQELLAELPPESLIGLPELDKKFIPQDPIQDYIELPLDFLFPISVRGSQTSIKFMLPGTPTTFPYAGTTSEPVIRQEGKRGVFQGRKYDQTVWLTYYRMPREMTVEGVENMDGDTYTGEGTECELPANIHYKLCYRAARSFKISDNSQLVEKEA
jgi:hypothetical protein